MKTPENQLVLHTIYHISSLDDGGWYHSEHNAVRLPQTPRTNTRPKRTTISPARLLPSHHTSFIARSGSRCAIGRCNWVDFGSDSATRCSTLVGIRTLKEEVDLAAGLPNVAVAGGGLWAAGTMSTDRHGCSSTRPAFQNGSLRDSAVHYMGRPELGAEAEEEVVAAVALH